MPVRSKSASLRASILSLLLPSFNRALRRGSQTRTCCTCGWSSRVEDWRHTPQVQPSWVSPFPLRVPHYPNRKLVSSPRRIKPSVLLSSTGLSCLLRAKGYETYSAVRRAVRPLVDSLGYH